MANISGGGIRFIDGVLRMQAECHGFHKTFLLVALLTFSTFPEITAQPAEFLFRQINTSDGLSNNQINTIIQDPNGYMWFGTEEGLNRFDGYEMKVFKKRLSDSTSISENHIISLFIDSKGQLWVGTYSGLCKYNTDKEHFIIFMPDSSQYMNSANRVTRIQEDSKHSLYFTTDYGSLYVLKDDEVVLIRDFSRYGNIKNFIIDRSDCFWLGSLEGVIRYDNEKDEMTLISGFLQDGKEIKLSSVMDLYEENEKIWIGSSSGQLVSIEKESLKMEMLPLSFLSGQFINDVFIDSNQVFNIATTNGIYLLDRDRKLIGTYNWEINNPFTISNNGVLCFYTDTQNNLWVGTMQGVSLAMNGKAFNNYNAFSQKLRLDVTNIMSMTVDSKDNIWLGSFNNGINIINPVTGQKKLFMPDPHKPGSVGEATVFSIFEDSRKNIWVGTYLSYLQRFDPMSGKFVSYNFNHLSNGAREVKDIRSMIEDKDRNLWFISHGFGLFKFNPLLNIYKYYTRDEKNPSGSLADPWAYQSVLVDDSIMWIATPSGLSRLNIYTESFKNYYYNGDDSTSLSNNHVDVVYYDSNHNLWVGTFFGLNLYCKETDSFCQFYEEDGLPSNQIKSFVEEKPGRIWIGTGYGLTCMDYTFQQGNEKPFVKFRNYDISDNLQDINFWERSACKMKTGEMIFGTKNGIIMFNPDDIEGNKTPPAVYITEFHLFNKKVNIGDFDSLLTEDISTTKEIRLKHKQNVIAFKYAAINYVASEKNKYAYMLEGFDDEWNYVGDKREAAYTNLPPRNYRFVVKASNNDGFWNETGASVSVRVMPPWWKTWWFTIIWVLSFMGFLLLAYYLRFAFYRNQQKKLSLLVRERTLQLEEVAVSLEEKQEEINSQKEELMAHRDELENVNITLVEQKEKILNQHNELEKHRNQLELLVEERTKELIEAKDKAEESDRLKSSFLANLSHEIRTPLNVILGFSSLIGERDLPDEKRDEYNKILQDSSSTLLELINDILDISKIEAGQMKLSLKPVPLSDVINNLSGIFGILSARQDEKSAKQVSLKIKIEKDVQDLQIVTDMIRLEQVLSNLVSNALKFTEKGFVEIGCTRLSDKNMLEFYVKDTGIGIKEENLKLIFERFRKVEEDKSHIYRGTGLGLAISTQLVSLMGGTMYVRSKPGEGSVFYFTIPLVESETTVTQAVVNKRTVNEIPDLTGVNILVAEDDILNFNFINRLLKKTSSNVIHAENGKQVIELMSRNHEIDLILMDIKMPEMDGIEALHELHKMGIHVPVIAQTAYAFADDLERLKNEGFKDCISKPINSGDFYHLLSNFLLRP